MYFFYNEQLRYIKSDSDLGAWIVKYLTRGDILHFQDMHVNLK